MFLHDMLEKYLTWVHRVHLSCFSILSWGKRLRSYNTTKHPPYTYIFSDVRPPTFNVDIIENTPSFACNMLEDTTTAHPELIHGAKASDSHRLLNNPQG
jgi:hypothetical protein